MEEHSFTEFIEKVQKKRGPKVMKVTKSWGVYDAFKHARKNGWYDIGKSVSEHEFYSIVRQINKLLAEEIANGRPVSFPNKMGKLELRKIPRGVSLVNGKLKVSFPPDWSETMRLWYEDEEARKNKTLVRDESPFGYKVKYDKFDATYENKTFYQFVLNKFVKQALKVNIKNGKIDSLW